MKRIASAFMSQSLLFIDFNDILFSVGRIYFKAEVRCSEYPDLLHVFSRIMEMCGRKYFHGKN